MTHPSDDATIVRDSSALPVVRNTALLSAVLADRTKPWERGSLLGFNDLLSSATGAGLTLLGGRVLTAAGVASLTIGAVALLVAPALCILLASDSSRRSS
jgi:hypothetical protein